MEKETDQRRRASAQTRKHTGLESCTTLRFRTFLCPRPGHDDCRASTPHPTQTNTQWMSLTIFSVRLHDDVTLDDQTLQARTLGREQRDKSQGRDPGRPEPLESFHIFAQSLDEHIQTRVTLDVGRLKELEDRVPLVVNQEVEWDDQTLRERVISSTIRSSQHRRSTWMNVAVFAVFMHNSIACKSSGRTGKTASPALRMR